MKQVMITNLNKPQYDVALRKFRREVANCVAIPHLYVPGAFNMRDIVTKWCELWRDLESPVELRHFIEYCPWANQRHNAEKKLFLLTGS